MQRWTPSIDPEGVQRCAWSLWASLCGGCVDSDSSSQPQVPCR